MTRILTTLSFFNDYTKQYKYLTYGDFWPTTLVEGPEDN